MNTASKRQRLDQLLVERGLVSSRAKARALILSGDVIVDEQRVDKAGTLVAGDAQLRLRQREKYVSRGGLKLEGALDELTLDPSGRICVDVGASTGGFTDCLLQRGAAKVYAVDVGRGLLARKLVDDTRVVVMDRTNARYLTQEAFEEQVDWVVVDASFIGVEKLLPALATVLGPGGLLLAMIKPQFEVGRSQASKHRGVIRDPQLRADAIASATAKIVEAGFEVVASCDCKLPGPKGNLEHFVHALRSAAAGA